MLSRRRRRFDPVGNEFLEAPQMPVVNAQVFEMLDGAVEVFGHRSPVAHRHGEHVGCLFSGEAADVTAAVAVDDNATARSGPSSVRTVTQRGEWTGLVRISRRSSRPRLTSTPSGDSR